MRRTALAAALITLALPLTGAAQDLSIAGPTDGQPAQPPATQGPMIVERVHNGFIVAPEVKATEFDKRAKPLVGGSAGWVFADTLFIGGGGFWLPEKGRSDRELAYGGAVVQWFLINGDRFGLSAKGLLGGGEATLPETITYLVPTPDPRTGRVTPQSPTQTVTSTVRVRQDFGVAEPELNARFAFSRHVRLAVGAGYRFAGTDWRRNGGFDRDQSRRLSGATATFGVQIGG